MNVFIVVFVLGVAALVNADTGVHMPPQTVHATNNMIDVAAAVISGLCSGGLVSAFLFFILKSFSDRLTILETSSKNVLNKTEVSTAVTEINARIDNRVRNLEAIVGEKVDKGSCLETKNDFKITVRDLALANQANARDNTFVQQKLASIETTLVFIKKAVGRLESIEDAEHEGKR